MSNTYTHTHTHTHTRARARARTHFDQASRRDGYPTVPSPRSTP